MTTILFACVLLFGGWMQAEPDTLSYRIRPVPTGNRTNLEISVRFKALDKRSQTVNLPMDYYGTPDIDRYVTSFEAETGSTVKPGKAPTERIVEPDSRGEIRLKYTLSYDPKVMDGISFGPNIGPAHFYCAGCQWMLQIGDPARKRRYVIEIVDPPRGWRVYSSIGPNPHRLEVQASYEDLITTAIGGGAGGSDRFTVRSRPVSVFVQGSFAIPNAEIFAAVKRIITLERQWFRDFDQPFYTVTILPRSGIIAGTCIPALFVCFAKSDITRDEMNILLAHEMFHTWLPNKLTIAQDKGESELYYEWFYEGFTDYFARKILAEAGLLSPEKFAELVNRDIINLADNPHRNATYTDLLAAAKAGKYNTAYKKLAYYRGALIALNWDATLRRAGKGKDLADFIRDLYHMASRSAGKITKQAFFDKAADSGLDARGDFERYILRGEPIAVHSEALGSRFDLGEVEVPGFDPGFLIEQTFRTNKITGVVENGPAHRAGLREGMELVRMQNSNRFGNAWYADKPLIVVTRSDAMERRFEFFPHGSPLRLMLFHPKGGGQQD